MLSYIKIIFKKIIKSLFKKIGLNISSQKPNYHYVPDFYGRSAYKHLDIRNLDGFSQLADTVIKSGKTNHYYDRLYPIYQSLINIHKRFGLNNNFNLAEVGVYKGGTSYFIVSTFNFLGITTSMLHCFDTFEGHVSQDINVNIDNTDVHKPHMFNDTDLETVQKHLSGFKNILFYKGRFQDTCTRVEALIFHFIHIDMDLYEPILFTLNFFDTRVVSGGIIVVDDYGFNTCPGAKKAVDEFMALKQNYFGIHLLSGQYIIVKIEDKLR